MEIEGSVGGPEDQGPQETTAESTPGGGDEASDREIEATDAARRKAEEFGVDLARIEGSGARGRVLVRDVQQAAR